MGQLKYSLCGGLGLLLAIAGGFGMAFGAAGNRPPAFLLPLGAVLLLGGVAVAVFCIAKARRLQSEAPPRVRARDLEILLTRPYPPVGESSYPHSLEQLPPMLESIAAQVRALAQPCVHLVAEPVQEPLAPTASKFGGVPYLAGGEGWPECPSGRPMTFIGQLNFGQIAADLADKGQTPPADMPTEGILSFFYDMEEMPWSGDETGQNHLCFRWTPDPQALDAAPAVPDQPEGPFERRLVPSVRPCLPSPADEVYGPAGLSEDAIKAYNELQVGILRTPAHQVLGHAACLQSDPRHRVSRSPAGREAGGDDRAWRLLWQIDTDEEAGFMWYDAGLIYILVHHDDLKARRFDRLWLELQCY